MKSGKLYFSIFAALFTSLSILPAHAATVTLFSDSFSDIATGNSTNVNASGTAWTGAGRYLALTNVYQAGEAVKLGKSTEMGSLTTTNLVLQAGTLRVLVDVKGWTSDEGDLKISVGGVEPQVFNYTSMMVIGVVTSFQKITADFEVAAGSNSVSFATTAKRCFLDNILITQEAPPSPEAIFTVQPQPATIVDELTPVQFTISAAVNDIPTNVTCTTTLPTGASYVFENSLGEFTWTPAMGQAGSYSFEFSALGSDGITYTRSIAITVTALVLTAPANLAVKNVKDRTFDASWNSVAAATQGYVVDVWYGSSSPNTPNADVETFFESINKIPVQPLGWTFIGITVAYEDKGLNEISMNDTGDTMVTKNYPRIVTNLGFRVQSRSTTATGDTELHVYGTQDGDNWTVVTNYTSLIDSDGNDENNIFSTTGGDLFKNIDFPLASGYRAFKFVLLKGKYNLGIGNIAAVYEGAGTKFIPGWQEKTTLSTLESIGGAKPARPYYLRVGAKNSTNTEYSTIRFQTLESPASTLITLR